MPTNGQDVKIAHYTRAKFNSLTNKNSATIYFVEEPDGKIKQYIGSVQVISDAAGTITVPEIEGLNHIAFSSDFGIVTGTTEEGGIVFQSGAKPSPTMKIKYDGSIVFDTEDIRGIPAPAHSTSPISKGYLETNTRSSSWTPSWSQVSSKPSFAPSNAQKNSDITKAEIEAKLTGSITSHTHNYRPAGNVPWTEVSGKPSFATVATTGSYNDLTNKPTIPSKVSDLTNDSDYIAKTYVDNHVSVLDGLIDSLANHVDSGLPTKVDKVSGKGLSTNDYTTTEKNKLAGIASGAQVNVGTNLSQGARNTTTLRIDSSTGNNLTLPAVTTSLAGLMTSTDKTRLDVLHSLLEEDTSNNVVDSITEVLAIFNNYPEGADLVTALAGKVDKVTGKGLSTNDYTTTEKNKLSGIEPGAAVNVQSNWNATAGDAFILNKPTIPAAQVQSNWNATTGMGVILNKPALKTVATTGSYNDLTNKPTIPSIPILLGTTEGNNGTATNQRTINAANLKSIILHHSPAGSRPASDVSAWAKKPSLDTTDLVTALKSLGNI